MTTLVAALVAALASVITLFAQRRSELRVAHRKALDSHIGNLSNVIHQTVATSTIIIKTRSLGGLENWRKRAATATQQLKEIRPQLRYPLWGLDEALLSLSRLPDWVEHARDYPGHALGLVERGRRLAKALDFGVRRSYLHGRPPRWYERALVSWRTKQFRTYYEKFQKLKRADRAERRPA